MDYYDGIADGYSELHGEEQLKKARIILERLAPGPNDTLLDVGCGDAAYLDIFNCDATGIDPSEKLLAKYRGAHQVVQGFAESLPFDDNEFDFVISITAVQNFESPEKGLLEISRVGRGKFAISVLKRSPKAGDIGALIRGIFRVEEEAEEDKDIIYFCAKKQA